MKKNQCQNSRLVHAKFFLGVRFSSTSQGQTLFKFKGQSFQLFLFGKNTLFSIMSKNGIIGEYEK